jgi:hypothetical protein
VRCHNHNYPSLQARGQLITEVENVRSHGRIRLPHDDKLADFSGGPPRVERRISARGGAAAVVKGRPLSRCLHVEHIIPPCIVPEWRTNAVRFAPVTTA